MTYNVFGGTLSLTQYYAPQTGAYLYVKFGEDCLELRAEGLEQTNKQPL